MGKTCIHIIDKEIYFMERDIHFMTSSNESEKIQQNECGITVYLWMGGHPH